MLKLLVFKEFIKLEIQSLYAICAYGSTQSRTFKAFSNLKAYIRRYYDAHFDGATQATYKNSVASIYKTCILESFL